jgi:excisionase family DNA binding protein
VKKVRQILTARELAAYLKLTEVTVYKYANDGKIPGFKVGNCWRFDKDKIDDLLVSRRNKDRS